MGKIMKLNNLVALAVLPIAMTTQIQAGDFTLGFGGYSSKSPYTDFEDESGALPIVEYEGDGFSVGVSGLKVDLINNEQSLVKLSAVLGANGSGFDEDDSKVFAGLKDRDSSIDLGLQVEYAIGAAAALEATLMADVSSTHRGYTFDVNYNYNMPMLGGYLQPAVGLEFQSAKFADYYYGVRANEATATRAAYQAGSAVNPYIEYSFVYPINKQMKIIHGTSVTKLSSEIKDSSIVDKSTTWTSFVGFGYTF
ncbi:MAG: outer membrane protein [Oceanospirillaceae bacterium]|jgi:outer membrane protein